MLPYLKEPAEREGRKAHRRPRRGLIGGVIVGTLFGLFALASVGIRYSGDISYLQVYLLHALSAIDPNDLPPPSEKFFLQAALLLALTFAFFSVRYWYREAKVWDGGFFSGLFRFFGRLRFIWDRLDLGAGAPWRWPFIILGLFLVYIYGGLLWFLVTGFAALTATPFVLALDGGRQIPEGAGEAAALLLIFAQYPLLGGLVGYLAQWLRRPLAPVGRVSQRVADAATMNPRRCMLIAAAVIVLLLFLSGL